MQSEYRNFGRATHCSIGFFSLFIALNAQQNIQSQMLEDDGYGKLGLYSNALIYLALAIGSVISTSVINRIGELWSMVFGSLLCVPFMASFLLPSIKLEYPEFAESSILFTTKFVYIVVLISSFVHGLAEGGLFVAQGKYISDCATESNKGFFFGYFWAFYTASQIIGNFVAAIMLGKLNQTQYVAIMSCISLMSCLIFVFMKKPIPHTVSLPSDKFKYDKVDTTPTPGQEITILNNNGTATGSILGDIQSVLRMAFSKRMRTLLPLCFWTGVSIAFYSGVLVSMITDSMPNEATQMQYQKSMMAMVVFGIGELIGCFFIGRIVDKNGSKFTVGVDLIIVLLMTMVTLMFLFINQFNWIAFLMTFMWGFQDSVINTHIHEMLGFEFDNNSEPFSVFNMVQAIAVVIFEILETHVETYPAYIAYTIFVGGIGFVACVITYFFEFKEDKVHGHYEKHVKVQIKGQ